MQSNDRIRVQHILDEAGEACKYAEGISRGSPSFGPKQVLPGIASVHHVIEAARIFYSEGS